MLTSSPLISIIMPVFNAAPYLEEAIQSVLLQDYKNWELLIVDDGSFDNSLSIARSFSDQRIKIFNQPNGGVSNARNLALRMMRGDLFCFLDADDVLTDDSLSLRMNCFVNDGICFADGRVDVFDSTMDREVRSWIPQSSNSVFKSLIRLDGKCFFGPTWMIRRKAGVHYQFDEALSHAEDLFFYISYSHLGEYAFTDRTILRYRKSHRSAMSDLFGLAQAYSLLSRKIHQLPRSASFLDKAIFLYRTRKIMFLSFLKSGNPDLAFRFLFWGSI